MSKGETMKWLLRFTNSTGFAIFIALVVVSIAGCVIYQMPFEYKNTQNITSVIQSAAIVLGLFSMVLIARQIRTTAAQTATQIKWSKSLSYHQFFGDLVTAEVRDKVIGVANDCDFLEQHKAIQPMKTESVNKINANSCHESIIAAYLDEFEEFCGAIHAGLLDEDYAYCLESTRVIKVWTVFEPYIEDTRKQTNFRTYLELEKIAEKWTTRRDTEDAQAKAEAAEAQQNRATKNGVRQTVDA